MKQTGVAADQVIIDDGALNKLIKYYCRESGVRNLKKHIEKIFRGVAFKIVKEKLLNVHVTAASLPELVGKPVFTSDRLYELTPPGIVTGLAWTSMGGSILFIEAALSKPLDTVVDSKDQGSIVVTGNLGKVMKESIQIANTFAKIFTSKYYPNNILLQRGHIHVHVPEVFIYFHAKINFLKLLNISTL